MSFVEEHFMRGGSKISWVLTSAALLAIPAAAHATTVYFDGSGGNPDFDVDYSLPAAASETFSTGPQSLGSVSFINNPGGDSMPGGDTRYYGGTIDFMQGYDSGYDVAPGLTFAFTSSASGTPIDLAVPDSSPTYWALSAYSYPGQLTGTNIEANPGAMALPSTTGTFDFVLKITDEGYDTASISLFLGANADSPTEPGTPDYTTYYNPSNYYYYPTNISDLSDLSITLGSGVYAGDPNPASLVTSNFFGSTVWTPVQSAVPEPATLSLIGMAGIGLLARRRRAGV
jgi:hypothetical protein